MEKHLEIERKFIIDEIPQDIQLGEPVEYEQGYLCTSPVVRVRREGNEYFLTYKSRGLMMREECNLPLDKESYSHLVTKTDYDLIRKNRCKIPYTDPVTGLDHIIEMDIFLDRLSPLVVAEVEFAGEEEARAFTVPGWFGREVTGDARYQNSNLCRIGYCDL